MIRIWTRLKKIYKVIFLFVFLVIITLSFFAFNEKDFEITKNLDIFVTLFREIDMYYVDGAKDPSTNG